MNADPISLQQDSPVWIFFVKLSFAVALLTTTLGIYFLPVDVWIKGYMAMGLYFCVASAISLSKTLRDEHEAKRLIKKISEVKTEKLLKEYDMAA